MRRPPPRWWCALLGCLLAAPSVAGAQELELALDSECEETPVLEGVEARLGRPLGQEPTALRARVALRRRGRRVRVVVGFAREGARSERAWWADDCAAAVRAAALVLALALDAETDRVAAPPEELPEPAADEPTSAPSILLVPVAAPPVPPEPPPAPPAEPDVRLTLQAGALVDVGTLPDAHGGARAGLGLALAPGGALRIELDATYLAATRLRSTAPGASVDVTVAYGSLRLGGLFALDASRDAGAISLGAMAELILGAAAGTGVGSRVQASTTTVLPWIAVRASAVAEMVVYGPISVRLTGSVGVPLLAPGFRVVGLSAIRPSGEVLVEGATTVVLNLS